MSINDSIQQKHYKYLRTQCSKCGTVRSKLTVAPICCKVHEICLNCYLELKPQFKCHSNTARELSLDKQCSSCSIIQTYKHPNCKNQEENSNSDQYTFLVNFTSKYIDIKQFNQEYVFLNIFPEDEYGEIGTENLNNPVHVPNKRYKIPMLFISIGNKKGQPPSLALQLQLVKDYCTKILQNYLNSFRVNKSVHTNTLLQLIVDSLPEITRCLNLDAPQKVTYNLTKTFKNTTHIVFLSDNSPKQQTILQQNLDKIASENWHLKLKKHNMLSDKPQNCEPDIQQATNEQKQDSPTKPKHKFTILNAPEALAKSQESLQ